LARNLVPFVFDLETLQGLSSIGWSIMAKVPRTFDELVKGLPSLEVTGLASAEAAPSRASLRAAQTLVGGFQGSKGRVARVAAKLDRLVELSKAAVQPRKRTQHG
jgi:hypothetical protein